MGNRLLPILLLLSLTASAQVNPDLIDFKKLTQFDSITIINVVDTIYRSYTYESGVLKNERSTYHGLPSYNTSFYYGPSSKTTVSKSITTGLSGTGQRYWEWTSHDDVSIEIIKNNKVVEESRYEVSGTDSTLVEQTYYSYDAKGRLIKETIYDHSTGYRNVFEPNSTKLADSYEKTEVYEKVKYYTYGTNTLTIEYKFNGELTSKDLVEFTNKSKPKRIITVDKDGSKIDELLFRYDAFGRILEREYSWSQTFTNWGEPADMASPFFTERVSYNSKGLPGKVVTDYGTDGAGKANIRTDMYTYY